MGKFAARPNLDAGNYQKHIDNVLGLGTIKKQLYSFKVPGTKMGTCSRAKPILRIRPVNEVVEHAVSDDPAIFLRLQEAKDGGELPACYHEHPIVKKIRLHLCCRGRYLWMGCHTV